MQNKNLSFYILLGIIGISGGFIFFQHVQSISNPVISIGLGSATYLVLPNTLGQLVFTSDEFIHLINSNNTASNEINFKLAKIPIVFPVYRIAYKVNENRNFLSDAFESISEDKKQINHSQIKKGILDSVSINPIINTLSSEIEIRLYSGDTYTGKQVIINSKSLIPNVYSINYKFDKMDNLYWKIFTNSSKSDIFIFNGQVSYIYEPN